MNFLNKIFGNSNVKKYKLSDLEPELVQHIKVKLVEAEMIILKYYGHLPEKKYDASVLDEVFEKWHYSTDADKERPEFVVEALGAAFGKDIVDSLNCEWQVWEDKQGKDLTVIHKKYVIYCFPFSTLQKAFSENRKRLLTTVKSVLKKNIEEAENRGEIEKRNQIQ